VNVPATVVDPATPAPAQPGGAATSPAPASAMAASAATSATPDVQLIEVTKRFGAVVAVDRMNLEIPSGSFTSLLGPSGCGKTTTLRMIAGFEQPTEGEILLAGHPIAGVPPYRRNVNTVFQHYALFPHMDVAQNVGYGLRQQKVPKADEQRRVVEALELVRLGGYGKRRTWEMSGGQQQRVALARALVNRPTVLLLDEPLGALDLKLRKEMQLELKALQREVGITFIYVTHDQEEALTMSDRLAVFNRGRIEQVGAPAEVYERPSTAFVAGFVGTSNLLKGEVARTIVGEAGTFTVRPEKIRLAEPADGVGADETSALGHIRSVVYLGSDTRFVVALDAGSELVVTQQNLVTSSTDALALEGKAVRLIWKRQHNYPVADAGG
jgi:putative spermidine/putrescine transport system ATP-binding protein